MREKTEKLAAKQGKSEVGYGKPPEQHQYKPGESGNPAGPPIHRTQLWTYFCEYMGMTDSQLEKVKAKKLSQSQQTAIVLVENIKVGKFSGSGKLMRYVVDRELGKAQESIKITGVEPLSGDECEAIRKVLRERQNG